LLLTDVNKCDILFTTVNKELMNMTITDAEWAVMELAWDKPGMSGREFVNELGESRGWSRSTVLTLLRRLEEKGAVRTVELSRAKVYYPAIEREDAAMSETADLIDRVYRGSLSQLVSTFTKKQALPKEEIDELYAMLKRMEGEINA